MSGGDLTIEELMIKLKEPLPEISGFLEIIWDLDEPSIYELSNILAEDSEFEEDKTNLTTEMAMDISQIVKEQSSDKSQSYNIDLMSPEEILEKLRCKCKHFKDKYSKKAELLRLDKDLSDYSLSLQTQSKKQKSNKTAEEERKAMGSNCKQFMSVKDYAISFIDDLLQEAEAKVNVQPYSYSMETIMYGEDSVRLETKISASEVLSPEESLISNLLIEDFTPKTGRELILEVIQNTWNLKKAWTYCVDFKDENSDTCTDFYIYEVKWSLPTMSYPVPQVTASVFFTIEVPRVKPADCPVNVTYNFESERYRFNLEDDIQQEIFLENIMKCKLDFFKSLRM